MSKLLAGSGFIFYGLGAFAVVASTYYVRQVRARRCNTAHPTLLQQLQTSMPHLIDDEVEDDSAETQLKC